MNKPIKSFESPVSRRQVMIGAAGLSFAVALGGRADAAVLAAEHFQQQAGLAPGARVQDVGGLGLDAHAYS